MSTLEKLRYVGRTAACWPIPGATGCAIRVRILDVHEAYGRIRYEVTPVEGRGTFRVENLVLESEGAIPGVSSFPHPQGLEGTPWNE